MTTYVQDGKVYAYVCPVCKTPLDDTFPPHAVPPQYFRRKTVGWCNTCHEARNYRVPEPIKHLTTESRLCILPKDKHSEP